MSTETSGIRFPNETEQYRRAREELLEAEIGLRASVEQVASLRRDLPLGGKVSEDYEFQTGELAPSSPLKSMRLSALLDASPSETVIIYNYMFGPNDQHPCVMCTSLLDGWNGIARHVVQRVNLAIVARSPFERLRQVARERGWTGLRLLSSSENSYNRDYHGEAEDGGQLPACNVFVRRPEGIFHFWSAEMLFADLDGQPRHMDLLWPLWNFFDLTPEGRGTDWYPSLSYDAV